ncbi:MAG: serine hydrolase [Cyclobacteriaceae bacterium]
MVIRFQKFSILIVAISLLSCSRDDEAVIGYEPIEIKNTWEEVTPEEVGVDGLQLNEILTEAELIERLRSVLIVRNSHLVLERYFHGATSEDLFDVRSITKSIIATLIMIAYENGRLESLDQTIDLGPGYELSDLQSQITFYHLLSMSSGIQWDEWESTSYNDWILAQDKIQHVLDLPFVANPGEKFTYNSGAVHLLGRALEVVLEEPLEDFADEVLFNPLGIEKVQWEMLSGIPNGGAGIDLRARDLARLGQLYLQNGQSGKQSIVGADRINQLVTPNYQMSWSYPAVPSFSYGLLWWSIDAPVEAYLAWGYGGQFIVVIPSYHTVVVTTTNWRQLSLEGGPNHLTSKVLDIVFDEIVPIIVAGESD